MRFKNNLLKCITGMMFMAACGMASASDDLDVIAQPDYDAQSWVGTYHWGNITSTHVCKKEQIAPGKFKSVCKVTQKKS